MRTPRAHGGHRARRLACAVQLLAASLLAQHRFEEALHAASALRDLDPSVPAHRAMVAEIQMELGRYDSARVAFGTLDGWARDLAVAPRLARWAEIQGRPGEARRLLRTALAIAERSATVSDEQLAGYCLRAGDLETRAGRLDEADAAYQRGLRVHAGDHRLLAALAHLSALRHRWADAVRYGEEAVTVNLDPATLGTLSDAYAALGDRARSDEYARVLDVAVRQQPGAYHRAWSLFLLDHGRELPTVHRKVREELRTRRDVYGWDLLAWSLYEQRRYAEARSASDSARAQGTRDALLLYHAGMIAWRAGDAAAARSLLSRALAINPAFHPSHPATARAALDSLAADGARR